MASDKLREKKKLEPTLKKKAKKINSKKKSTTKKKSAAKKKSTAKNEKLEKYKAKIPKGRFYKKK